MINTCTHYSQYVWSLIGQFSLPVLQGHVNITIYNGAEYNTLPVVQDTYQTRKKQRNFWS